MRTPKSDPLHRQTSDGFVVTVEDTGAGYDVHILAPDGEKLKFYYRTSDFTQPAVQALLEKARIDYEDRRERRATAHRVLNAVVEGPPPPVCVLPPVNHALPPVQHECRTITLADMMREELEQTLFGRPPRRPPFGRPPPY